MYTGAQHESLPDCVLYGSFSLDVDFHSDPSTLSATEWTYIRRREPPHDDLRLECQ